MFQSMLLRYGLGMTVVELTLLVDVQPTASLVVLVALDVAGLPLPLVTGGIGRQRIVERCIMPVVDFRRVTALSRLQDRELPVGIAVFALRGLVLWCLSWSAPSIGVGELAFRCSVLRPRQRRLC